MEEHPETADNDSQISSPFAGVRSSVSRQGGKQKHNVALVGSIIGGLLVLAIAVFFIQKALNDPLRTLREFPVAEYYENHASLEGTRFRARLKTVEQLGWKEEIGRLIICSVGDGDQRVVVLVDQKFDGISFAAGDVYDVELRVLEGGLLSASQFRKE